MKRLSLLVAALLFAIVPAWSLPNLTPPATCMTSEELLDAGGQGVFKCVATNTWVYRPVASLLYLQLNVPNGIAGLDVSGKIPVGLLPSGLGGGTGNQVLSGSGAPSSGTGNDGDFYIRTSNSTLYGPKASGSWPAPVSLIGATGATGSAGSSGSNGLGITARGAWSSATAYVVNDLVSLAGSSYIAIATGTNFSPDTNPAKWTLVASKGDTGSGSGTGLSDPGSNGIVTRTALNTTGVVAGPTGAIVGTSDTQTLTNKSISGAQINSGTIPAAQLPLATTSAFGAVKPDGTTITISGGVISSTGGTGITSSVIASRPSTCGLGTFYGLNDGNPGRWLSFCSATNTWSLLGSIDGSGLKYNSSGDLGLDLTKVPLLLTDNDFAGNITVEGNITLNGTCTGTGCGGGSSPLTTKGDLWAYSTTNARLPIGGTNGWVLTVDNTQTFGMKWAAQSGGSGTQINDSNGNPTVVSGGAVTGAVNFIAATNAATGNGATLTATGSDSSVDLNLNTKGFGSVKIGDSSGLWWAFKVDTDSGRRFFTSASNVFQFDTDGNVISVTQKLTSITAPASGHTKYACFDENKMLVASGTACN